MKKKSHLNSPIQLVKFMNRNMARIEWFLTNSGHILLIKKISIHGCDTSMEYLKLGPLSVYPFNIY